MPRVYSAQIIYLFPDSSAHRIPPLSFFPSPLFPSASVPRRNPFERPIFVKSDSPDGEPEYRNRTRYLLFFKARYLIKIYISCIIACRYFPLALLWQNNIFQATYYLLYNLKYDINCIKCITEHIFDCKFFQTQHIHIYCKNLQLYNLYTF